MEGGQESSRRQTAARIVGLSLVFDFVVCFGGSALAGFLAASAANSTQWGWAGSFMWLALLMVIWLIVMAARPTLRQEARRIYARTLRRQARWLRRGKAS